MNRMHLVETPFITVSMGGWCQSPSQFCSDTSNADSQDLGVGVINHGPMSAGRDAMT
jgi:hypothetical protein